MISIDKLAYISELKKVNPIEKFVFAIVTMMVGIWLNNIIVSIIILILMSAIIVLKGKIPFKIYIKLIFIPLAFLIIGVLTIAINVNLKVDSELFSFRILNINFGCTYESILSAIKVFFKSIASVSCLYFLNLTTPFFEILSVLRKLKIPQLLIELIGLIYRFIFVLLDTANMIYISQSSRLGYSTTKIGFNSLGKLITALFISSYKHSQDAYIAMESRCYDGDINVLENNYEYSYKNLLKIIITELILIIIGII